jgi:competence protein ComEC
MLAVFILTILSKRHINAWTAWSLALFSVLLLNPLSVLTESFWLSFTTIALIIIGMHGRLSPSGIWWKWGRVQWVIAIGLIPMTLILFQQFSLISFIANSVAIPWLGFLILPFCFLSSIFLLISPSIGHVLLIIADKSLSYLWEILAWMAQLHFAAWQMVIPNYLYLILMVTGFIFLLLPIGTPGKWLGFIWILPVIFYQPLLPTDGDVWLTLLDVGQGLSVVVQTKNHLLVYDAGPSFGDHFDMGESIVTPYLHTIAAKSIDKLVISHGDNDHIGGAQAIMRTFNVKEIQTSVPEKFPAQRAQYCLAGEKWQWDKVQFTFLYPNKEMLELGNDSSCVLRIDNGKQVVLLTGDIEKNAEKFLLAEDVSLLKTDIVIAPHHGSKTSGFEKFILAMKPKIVLYSTGYRNRYHFPHQSVVRTYQKINAMAYNTVESGTMQFKLNKDKDLLVDDQYRLSHKKYWH